MGLETQYARRDDVHVAYQVVGEGEIDLVLVSSWFSHVEAQWEFPSFAYYLRRLSSFSRLISFDKYGIGLSDPVPSKSLPPLEEWVDDVCTVMDAAGSEEAAIVGANEGAIMAALFAATHPDRVRALVLANPTARLSAAPGYPIGMPPEAQERLVAAIEQGWGRGDAMAAVNPTLADDPAAAEAWGRFLRLSASPATAAAVVRMVFELDIRDVLPTITAPTLVVHRRDNPIVPLEHGRYVAERIPGARFAEVPGVDYAMAIGDVDVLVDEVEEFLTGAKVLRDPTRVLATVLFTDIVRSTEHMSEVGDRRWREVLEAHDVIAQREITRYDGVLITRTGDGVLATFDGPARAIRCALSVRDALRGIGLTIRAGLHTGEIEQRDGNVSGLAVHIAARVLAGAEPDEVLVSHTVKDLVAGGGLRFAERGMHELKGVSDKWALFRVES